MVVARMARRVDEFERPPGELEAHAVGGAQHPCGRHAHHLAVRARDLRFAIDGGGALDQPPRKDQVACAVRMHDEARARQRLHQQADSARMVEMDMGGDDPVDRVARDAQRVEGGQKARHRMVGAGVDESGAARFDDQEARVETRPVKAGVDDVDAMRVVAEERFVGRHSVRWGEGRRRRFCGRAKPSSCQRDLPETLARCEVPGA